MEDDSMLNRETYLKSIIESITRLCVQISGCNDVSLYDVNIIAESFYARLLNLVEGLNLVNANTIEKNAQGIDLFDEENRISIQVTSDNSSSKIKHSIEEFIDGKLYERFDRLVILILGNQRKKDYRTGFDTQGKFVFDKNTDIWDSSDLFQKINALSTEKLAQINEYLCIEFDNKYGEFQKTEANEIETIIDLIEFISGHKQKYERRDVVIDPEYKIYKRFQEFAKSLVDQYTMLLGIYGSALVEIEEKWQNDEVQDLVTMLYLQDISIQYLDAAGNNPVKALDSLVGYFSTKLGQNGKKYDRMAIKFYLVNKMIQCCVFPNERGEYNDSKS